MKRQACLSFIAFLTVALMAPAGAAQAASTASILFSRTHAAPDGSSYTSLYRVKPSGQNIVPLTSAQSGINYQPGDWSPSGSAVVYERLRDDSPGRSQLFVVDRQGGSPHRITTGSYRHQQPSWGPGGIIAYVSDRGNHNLCLSTVHADGQGQRDLFCPDIFDRPTEPMTLSTPRWTPSGNSVVFEAAAYEDDLDGDWVSHVYRVNVTTGAVVQLTQQHRTEQSVLAVAPDAKQGIYFNHLASYPMSRVDFATGMQTTLMYGRSPHYSRDSGKIAFDNDGRIFVMNADGSDVHAAIAAPSANAAYAVADWSWDGTRLLVNKVGDNRRMQIVDLATGATSTVTDGTAAQSGWYHD
jgi:Tol biopolymer transport system component